MENERILVVDDDEKICQILMLYLRSKGYEVVTCKNGNNALSSLADSAADLMILDVNLPGMDGFRILENLRSSGGFVPVIMLTARSGLEDRIRALDAGADDYIVKPFDPKELVARIRAVLRRSSPGNRADPNGPIRAGDLTLCPPDCTAARGDTVWQLSRKEFDLLRILVLNRGRAVKREELLSAVWDGTESSRSLDVHIRRIRSKIGDDLIKTVWRVGYRFDANDDPTKKEKE